MNHSPPSHSPLLSTTQIVAGIVGLGLFITSATLTDNTRAMIQSSLKGEEFKNTDTLKAEIEKKSREILSLGNYEKLEITFKEGSSPARVGATTIQQNNDGKLTTGYPDNFGENIFYLRTILDELDRIYGALKKGDKSDVREQKPTITLVFPTNEEEEK